jgi:hypothetical protein
MDIPTDDQRRQAEWRLLNAQIDLQRRQARWEPWKALAAILAAGALMGALVIALSNWRTPQTISVHLDQPLQVQVKP